MYRPKTYIRDIETLVKKAERLNTKVEALLMDFIALNKKMNETIDDYKRNLTITEG